MGKPVLGVDGFYASIKGQDSGMVVAVDMGTGKPVALARIDEKDRPALFAWLEVLKEDLGGEVLVTDDFSSYSTAAERWTCSARSAVFTTSAGLPTA